MAPQGPAPSVDIAGVGRAQSTSAPTRSGSSAQSSLALSRGIDFETPNQTLPPASAPEMPSFCLTA